jgi:nucleoid DNA-binding protein
MFFQKRTNHYLGELSKRHGISREDCKTIIKFFFVNLRRSIYKGQEVHIERFGRIVFNKLRYFREVLKK